MAIMLAAKDQEIASMPAYQFVSFPEEVRRYTDIDDNEKLIMGIGLGYRDTSVPVNRITSTRLPPDQMTKFYKQEEKAGNKVILTVRRMAQVTPLAKKQSDRGPQAVTTPLDISDGQSVKAAATFVQSHYGKLNVLISNATLFGEMKTVENTDIDELTNQFNTNVIGTYRGYQGDDSATKRISTWSDCKRYQWCGFLGDPVYGLQAGQPSDYGITKLTTNGLTVKLAHELKSNYILVNSVCPDVTATRWSMGQPV